MKQLELNIFEKELKAKLKPEDKDTKYEERED